MTFVLEFIGSGALLRENSRKEAGQPFANGVAHERKLAGEKMICVLYQHELFRLSGESEDPAQIVSWCKLIVVAADEQRADCDRSETR